MHYLDDENEFQFKAFPSKDLTLVKEWIEANPNIEEIGITGGRTEQLLAKLKTKKSIDYIVEFDATIKGVKYLLKKEGHEIQKSIITNVGTERVFIIWKMTNKCVLVEQALAEVL